MEQNSQPQKCIRIDAINQLDPIYAIIQYIKT